MANQSEFELGSVSCFDYSMFTDNSKDVSGVYPCCRWMPTSSREGCIRIAWEETRDLLTIRVDAMQIRTEQNEILWTNDFVFALFEGFLRVLTHSLTKQAGKTWRGPFTWCMYLYERRRIGQDSNQTKVKWKSTRTHPCTAHAHFSCSSLSGLTVNTAESRS